jgi:hypothetical protein
MKDRRNVMSECRMRKSAKKLNVMRSKTYIWHGGKIELTRTAQQFGFRHSQRSRALVAVVPSQRRRQGPAGSRSAVTAAAEPNVQNIVADNGI